MQSHLINFWLYLYLSCIYFLPLIKLIRLKERDTKFLLRKMLFPLEYLIQIKLEKTTNYSRSAIRLGHILVWLMSIFGLMFATVPIYIFNEPYENHTSILLFITYYLMFAPISFWFQPRSYHSK
ncbi:hypothetical protein FD956_08480 [Leuconostoc carnosum]|jgi:CDP-diglyceride synthetase|nr:hypothetical protein FE412_09085 [Leuconostoc carnosum]KAA8378681.1 hypothetical protein FD956_08480 [Leuconostoc carnosum]QBC40667.1 hypothetical protein EQK02_10400 [Leuconostoc mesenteroides]QHM59333.1 hypothetical protein C7M45_02100 [Leuconostoc mesenteroides]